MKKSHKIIYWVSTIWLCLALLSNGSMQLINYKPEVERIGKLGFPPHFLTLIGIWKVCAMVAILIPRFPLIKEWAYAGVFFVMSGAVFSHLITGSTFAELIPSLVLLIMTVLSWYFRPADKKIANLQA